MYYSNSIIRKKVKKIHMHINFLRQRLKSYLNIKSSSLFTVHNKKATNMYAHLDHEMS